MRTLTLPFLMVIVATSFLTLAVVSWSTARDWTVAYAAAMTALTSWNLLNQMGERRRR